MLACKMRTSLRKTNDIIIACAVLHNIAIESKLDLNDEPDPSLGVPELVQPEPCAQPEHGRRTVRLGGMLLLRDISKLSYASFFL